MAISETLRYHGDRLRVRPWKDHPGVAGVVPLPARSSTGQFRLRAESVAACLGELERRGFHTVVTSALALGEEAPFRAHGFETHHELHLLSRSLDDIAPLGLGRNVRRARRRDWPAVLDIDGRAFDSFWQFDAEGIEDALAATPSHRFRVTRGDDVRGYHISGRAASAGFLQRLAVDPTHHGQGVGSILLADALSWMASGGATVAWVNTQVGNDQALTLYLRRGFQEEANRLRVLTRRIAAAPAEPDQMS